MIARNRGPIALFTLGLLVLSGCPKMDQNGNGNGNGNGNDNSNNNTNDNRNTPEGQFFLNPNTSSSLLGTARTTDGQVVGFYGSDSGAEIGIERLEVVENGESILIHLDAAARPIRVEFANGDRVEYAWTETAVTVTTIPADGPPVTSGELPLSKSVGAPSASRASRKADAEQSLDRTVQVVANITCEGAPRRNLDDVFIEIQVHDEDLSDGLLDGGVSRFPAVSQGDGRYIATIPVTPRFDFRAFCERLREELNRVCPEVDIWTVIERGCAAVPQCLSAVRAMRVFCFIRGIPILCDAIPDPPPLQIWVTRDGAYVDSVEMNVVAFSNLSSPLEIPVQARCNESSVCECFSLTLVNACIEGRPCESSSSVTNVPEGERVLFAPRIPPDYTFVTWGPEVPFFCFPNAEFVMDSNRRAEAFAARMAGLNSDIEVAWQPTRFSVALDPGLQWLDSHEPVNTTYEWSHAPDDQLVLHFDPVSSPRTTAFVQLPGEGRAFPIRLPVTFTVSCEGSPKLWRTAAVVVTEPDIHVDIASITPSSATHYFPCQESDEVVTLETMSIHASVSPAFPADLYSAEVRVHGPDGGLRRTIPIEDPVHEPGVVSVSIPRPFLPEDVTGTYRIVLAVAMTIRTMDGVEQRFEASDEAFFELSRECTADCAPLGYVMDEAENACVCGFPAELTSGTWNSIPPTPGGEFQTVGGRIVSGSALEYLYGYPIFPTVSVGFEARSCTHFVETFHRDMSILGPEYGIAIIEMSMTFHLHPSGSVTATGCMTECLGPPVSNCGSLCCGCMYLRQ